MKKEMITNVAVGVVTLAVGFVGGFAVAELRSDEPDVTAEPAATSTPEAKPSFPPPQATQSTEPEVVYHEPTADDFELTIKTLEKECFGSAGCNVEFRVELSYLGLLDLDPSVTYELTYEIKGGEDPLINTLEITGDEYSVDESEDIGTESSDDELTAVVLDVSEY
jgi:hypothetical protein